MAQLLVRKLDDDVKEKLQKRACRHGRSTEEEVREILRNAVSSDENPVGLGTELLEIFRGIDEEIPELRGYPPQPAEFDP
jgi:plasmid stability protein